MNNLLFAALFLCFSISLQAQNTPPVASCVATFTADLDADGDIALAPEDLNDGSSDDETPTEDLGLALDFGGPIPTCDQLGLTITVTLIVMDGDGLSSSCTSQVRVRDNTAPEVTCQNVVVELNDNGRFGFSLGFALNVILTDFVDNCAASPASASIAGGPGTNCNELGVSTRTFFYRDGNGQEDRCAGVRLQVNDPLGVCGEDPIANCAPFTVTNPIEPTVTLNANVFDDGSSDDRSIYALVYSDATDRQENTTFDCSTTGFNQGQTFTAGQTGVIQSIKVRAGASTNTTLFVRSGGVFADTAGQHIQNVELFFGEHSGQANLTVMTLDRPFPVVAGQEYSFNLSGETTLSRSCPGSPAYADGRPILGFFPFSDTGDEDLTFEVNIIGPTEMEFPTEGGTLVTVFAVDDQGNVSEGCATSVNPDQSLPVEWLFFGAHVHGLAGTKQVDLSWETTEEPDNAGFHVERSAGNGQWLVIGQVAARAGTNQRYDFTDKSPIEGLNYYRIRQTDFDGQVVYSHVETVEFSAADRIVLYPNPATNQLALNLPSGAELVGLLNARGQQTGLRFRQQEDGFSADVSALNPGVYFLHVRLASGQSVTRRLVVR